MSLEKLSTTQAFAGELVKYKVTKSESLGGTDAQFNVFLPAAASKGKVPVLVYLAGLTCSEDNG
jgi:S-formylglutathione hydrolase